MEIYFEIPNLDEIQKLKNNTEIIYSIREHPWGQRAFRIYDPDHHIIEIAESMSSVVIRLHHERKSIDKIA